VLNSTRVEYLSVYTNAPFATVFLKATSFLRDKGWTLFHSMHYFADNKVQFSFTGFGSAKGLQGWGYRENLYFNRSSGSSFKNARPHLSGLSRMKLCVKHQF